VSRLEGFSDTVFGFALTLLVISLKAPDSSNELLAYRHSVLPFVVSFLALFRLWRLQFDFFRRFGLEDGTTIRLTGFLLMFVLLAVYPLRFLATFAFDVLPRALLAGNDSMKAVMPMEMIPKILMLYAIGFGGIMAVLALLYRHAAAQSDTIGLSELELFETRAHARRFVSVVVTNGAIVLWCVMMLSLGADHIRARDSVWSMGYRMGQAGAVLVAVAQGVILRRLNRRRPGLSSTSTTSTAPTTPALVHGGREPVRITDAS
jgi:Predicted integral membrane protein